MDSQQKTFLLHIAELIPKLFDAIALGNVKSEYVLGERIIGRRQVRLKLVAEVVDPGSNPLATHSQQRSQQRSQQLSQPTSQPTNQSTSQIRKVQAAETDSQTAVTHTTIAQTKSPHTNGALTTDPNATHVQKTHVVNTTPVHITRSRQDKPKR